MIMTTRLFFGYNILMCLFSSSVMLASTIPNVERSVVMQTPKPTTAKITLTFAANDLTIKDQNILAQEITNIVADYEKFRSQEDLRQAERRSFNGGVAVGASATYLAVAAVAHCTLS